jgi:hypothetical protein
VVGLMRKAIKRSLEPSVGGVPCAAPAPYLQSICTFTIGALLHVNGLAEGDTRSSVRVRGRGGVSCRKSGRLDPRICALPPVEHC